MSSVAIIDIACETHGVQYDVMVDKDDSGNPVAACGEGGCEATVTRWWGGYSSDVKGSGFAAYEAIDPVTGKQMRIDTRDAESDYLKAAQSHNDDMVRRGYTALADKRPDKLYVMTEREARNRHSDLVERNFEFRRKNNLPTNNVMRDMRIKL